MCILRVEKCQVEMDPPPLAPIQPMASSSAMATAAAAAAPSSAMPSSASGASAGGADPDPSTQPYHFPPESIRVYAETLNTALGEEVAKEMAEDMTFRRVYSQIAVLRNGNMNATISFYRLRKLIQDSQRFMFHAKRSRLLGEDIDLALRVEGQEPIYGTTVGPEFIPFREPVFINIRFNLSSIYQVKWGLFRRQI